MRVKLLISEDERRRILNLHNSRIKSKFKNLLSEQDPNLAQPNNPDLTAYENKLNDEENFINMAKEQINGFPKDGLVVNLDGHGFVYEVRKDNPDGTVGTKYYLKQDGSVVGPDMKTIAKNKWYTTPIQSGGQKQNFIEPQF